MTDRTLPTADTFTGQVRARVLRSPDAESALAVYEVTFAPAARTHWHTHPRGQALYVTDGRARVQLDGRPAAEYGPGDYVWIPPETRHWHGASDAAPMTHVAVQEAAPDGSTITWCEAVPDATYHDFGPDTDTDEDDH